MSRNRLFNLPVGEDIGQAVAVIPNASWVLIAPRFRWEMDQSPNVHAWLGGNAPAPQVSSFRSALSCDYGNWGAQSDATPIRQRECGTELTVQALARN